MGRPVNDHNPGHDDASPPAMIKLTRIHSRHGRGHTRLGLNLTAMIDVVFLLLVYFMAATEFKLGEEIYRLDLPQRGAVADPFELPRDPLRVVVASTGSNDQAYLIRLEGPYPQPGSAQELYDFLRQNRRSDGVLGGLFEADHPVIIEPTHTTRWDHVIEAFNAVARARYTNITFARPG